MGDNMEKNNVELPQEQNEHSVDFQNITPVSADVAPPQRQKNPYIILLFRFW